MSPKRTRPTVGADMDRWVGQRLRMRRQQLQISMANLATQLGTLRQTLEKWELGRARLSVGQLYEVSAALGVHPGWFFDDYPGQHISQHRPRELDTAMQVPDAMTLLMAYARLDPTERAAVLVLTASAGRDREPSVDGKGKAFVEFPEADATADDDDDDDNAETEAEEEAAV